MPIRGVKLCLIALRDGVACPKPDLKLIRTKGGEMKLTEQWLREKSACSEGVEWFLKQKETDAVKVLKKLIKEKQLPWANWTIVRVMNYKQRVQYAVFAAEQVIGIFEKKYPDDKRPRQAIEAAKKCIDNSSEENKNAAAYAAAYADAAYADAAAFAAAYAAYAALAAAVADAAANAAYADAAAFAAAVADAAAYADAAMRIKILEYGIKLLKELKE